MKLNKKSFLLIGLTLLVFFVFTETASAQEIQGLQIPGCTGLSALSKLPTCVIGWGSLAISYLISAILGLGVMVGGWLVGFTLNFNLHILDDTNSLVYVGWKIVRDVANLGFVLFIIIIAFATILRREQYGVKKLLPKLIAAAIIVNFSLTIAGVFIDFSNVLTGFFINRVAAGDAFKMGETMVSIFQPQRFYVQKSEAGGENESQASLITFGATLINAIAKLIFQAIFMLLAVLTFLAFAVMLFLRYIYLSFLLLLSPIIWLFWVIPNYSKYFSEWWQKFTSWVFFAPALSFFIYLALKSAETLASVHNIETSISGDGSIGAELAKAGLRDTLIQGTQMIVLIFILIGGLLAAQKLGVATAGGAIKLAQNYGNKARGWAGRQGTRAGLATFRGVGGQKLAERMQKSTLKPVSFLGSRISDIGGKKYSENLVKQAEKEQSGLSDRELALRINSMGRDQQIAALTRLSKNRNLDMVPGGIARFIADPRTKRAFGNYGKGKEYTDMEKAYGANTEILTAKDETVKEKAMRDFFQTFSADDFGKMQKDALTKDEDRVLRIKVISEANPGAIAKFLPKFSGKDFDTLMDGLKQTLPETIKIGIETSLFDEAGERIVEEREIKRGDVTEEQMVTYFKSINKKFGDSLEKNLAQRVMGFSEFGAPPAPPPPPAAPTT